MKAFSSTRWILLLAACLPVSMLAASYPDISGYYNATVNYVVGFSEHGILVDTETYSNTSPAQIYASGKGFILTISDPPFTMTTYDPSRSTPLTNTVILSGNKVTSMSGRVLSTATTDGGGDVITSDKITSATGAVGLNEIQISGTGTAGGTFDNGLVTISYAVTFSIVLAGNVMPLSDLSLVVTAPDAHSVTVSDANYVFAGLASSGFPISQVLYSLNGSAWNAAETTNLWENWSADITLTPGKNVLMAYAVDIYGNVSTTSSNVVNFIQTRPPSAVLVLQVNGYGAIQHGAWPQELVIGKEYAVTAVPMPGNVFSNWVGGTSLPYSALSASPTYTFTMQSNLVLQANFVSNPFLAEQGTFNGLFMEPNTVTEAGSGFFTLNLTTTGSFTGKIMTSGGTYSLPTTAKFDVGGQAEFAVRTKQTTLTFNLQLNIGDPASEKITGTVFDGTSTAELTADRAVFSAASDKAVNYEGQYTLAIAGSEDGATSPGGFGWATLSVSSVGLITMTGNLADGTAMAQSVSVSKDGRWPFYASYAAPPAGNGGSVISWITFSNQPNSLLGGTMYWFRPAGKTPSVYQTGFTNLTVPIIGSAYKPTEKPLLGLTTGQVTLDGGSLPFAITNQINLASNDTISLAPASENTNKLALTIHKTTGVISGSFANPADAKQTIKVNGVLLQNQTNAAGYFLGTNESGAFLLQD